MPTSNPFLRGSGNPAEEEIEGVQEPKKGGHQEKKLCCLSNQAFPISCPQGPQQQQPPRWTRSLWPPWVWTVTMRKSLFSPLSFSSVFPQWWPPHLPKNLSLGICCMVWLCGTPWLWPTKVASAIKPLHSEYSRTHAQMNSQVVKEQEQTQGARADKEKCPHLYLG